MSWRWRGQSAPLLFTSPERRRGSARPGNVRVASDWPAHAPPPPGSRAALARSSAAGKPNRASTPVDPPEPKASLLVVRDGRVRRRQWESG
jgi:hypothetical protein